MAGSIEELELQNFMCHAFIPVVFAAGVSFLGGANGCALVPRLSTSLGV